MQDCLYVDIETFSKTDIRTAGTVRYCENVEVMLIGFKLNGRYDYYDYSVPEKAVIPDWVGEHILDGGKVVAHNALFEFVVLLNFYEFPRLKLTQMVDTMALCGAAGLPLALGKATKAMGASIEKYDGGTRLITKFCIPRKPSKHNKSVRNMPGDFPDDWVEFRDVYLRSDIESMEELHDFLPPLTDFEQQVWVDTQIINLQGIPVDVKTTKLIVDKLDAFVDEQSSEFIRIVGLFPTQRDKVLGWVRTQGVKVTDLQAATVQKVIDDHYTPANVRRALTFRANTSHMSFKKYNTILAAVRHNGTVGGTLSYHAAHTGRFGGRLLQPQNLTKGNIDGEEAVARIQAGEFNVDLIKSAVRPMIHHSKGFTIVDWAQVEARGTQWLVKDWGALKAFTGDLDPYKQMATFIYEIPYSSVTDKQRFVGKQAVLGLGYQMGWKKFKDTCESYGEAITVQEAKKAVEVYRAKHRKLKQYWSDINEAAMMAVNRINDTIVLDDRISFIFDGHWLHMNLPSGRSIKYFEPNISIDDYGDSLSYMVMNSKNQWVRTSTYGGKLIENAVQGVCRDILVGAVRELTDREIRVATHIHDEIVVVGHHLEEVSEIMNTVPEWAKDFPLDCEGVETTRYKKI